MKIRPVSDWQRAWRWFSVHIGAAAVGFGVMPPDMQASVLTALNLPAERVPAVLGVFFLAGRLLGQQKREQPPKDEE